MRSRFFRLASFQQALIPANFQHHRLLHKLISVVRRLIVVVVVAGSSALQAQTAAAPQLLTQLPDTLAVIAGETSVGSAFGGLYATVNGLFPMTAQWIKDGRPIGAPTTLVGTAWVSFTISNAQAGDAGDYAVTVSNSAGNVTSRLCRVSVVPPLVITSHPEAITGPEGTRVTLSVSATGPGPLSYQWYRANPNSPIEGGTAGTLTVVLPDQQPIGPGSGYYVRVSNPYQTVTSRTAAALTLRPPVFTLEPPAALQLGSGGTAFLAFECDGTTPLVAQWWLNGNPTPNNATPSSLRINAPLSGETADYSVTVSNAAGMVTSRTCRVTAVPALRIVAQPSNQSVGAGGTIQLSTTATGGFEPLSYQWYFGAVRGYEIPITGGNSPTLIVTNVRPEHTESYFARVTAVGGGWVETANVRVTVTGTMSAPPTFIAQPQNRSVETGSSISLTGHALAAVSYRWTKNGQPLANGNGQVYSLFPAQAADAGTYVLIATNAAGSTSSAPVDVIVTPANGANLSITSAPVSQRAIAGDTVRFSVSAIGANPIRFQWGRNGLALPGETTAGLTIHNVSEAHAGTYSVIASAVGAAVASANATLDVEPPTLRLRNLSVRAFTDSGGKTLIAGFATTGDKTKRLLIRGIGPALGDFGVTGILGDPLLTVANESGATIATAANWSGDASLAAAFARAGAFPLRANSRDAALIVDMPPRPHTVRISSQSGSTGTVLAEVYDLDDNSDGANLINLSSRTIAGNGEQPFVAGFVLAGNGRANLVVRAIGPALRQFGADDALANVSLELHTTVGEKDRVIATNRGWGSSPLLQGAFAQVGAFPLATTPQDAAIVTSLTAGTYTVVVNGLYGSAGAALVEIYLVR
jgi:hypothetical protein